jgi:hypothetical protein
MGEDALDRPRGKQKFSKKEKAAYAQKCRAEELALPPKDGLAPFLADPSLLPKKPPPRRIADDKDD